MFLDDLLVSYKQVTPIKREVIENEPLSLYDQLLTNLSIIKDKNINTEETSLEDKPTTQTNKEQTIKKTPAATVKPIVGSAEFEKAYDEVEKTNPEAKKYRQFLTKMAKAESGFNKSIQNLAGAPAYGYFQFMQDGNKYNNISHYANTDIETFRNNPKIQIEAAIKLAKDFEKGFNSEDLKKAKELGYTTFGLLGGAWLAGNGGVKKLLYSGKNLSDKHWSSTGQGTTVLDRIREFNFRFGGKLK